MTESSRNCWEVMMCGREPGGSRAAEIGVCPAAIERFADGLNHGRNGGRICWSVAGTLCQEKVQGSFAQKRDNCLACPFFNEVKEQEGTDFTVLRLGCGQQPGAGSM